MEPIYFSEANVPSLTFSHLVRHEIASPPSRTGQVQRRPHHMQRALNAKKSTCIFPPHGSLTDRSRPSRLPSFSKHKLMPPNTSFTSIVASSKMQQPFRVQRRSNDAVATEDLVHWSLPFDVDQRDMLGQFGQRYYQSWTQEVEKTGDAESKDQGFQSLCIYCEMKLREAQLMTKSVEKPNRFFTGAVCLLMRKTIDHLGPSQGLMKTLFIELLRSLYVEMKDVLEENIYDCSLQTLTPYFVGCKQLEKQMRDQKEAMLQGEEECHDRRKRQLRYKSVLISSACAWQKTLLTGSFLRWKGNVIHKKKLIQMAEKISMKGRTSLKDVFRAWRIEALRQGYQRETKDYQSMLSETVDTISTKDSQLADALAKIEDLELALANLAESHSSLTEEVKILRKKMAAASKEKPAVDSEELDRRSVDLMNGSSNTNLLESLFSMARMVDLCAIQLSADTIQHLAQLRNYNDVYHLARMTEKSMPMDDLVNIDEHKDSVNEFQLIHQLEETSYDSFLLRWVTHQLQQSSADAVACKTLDFGSDFCDGLRFGQLLNYMYPNEYPAHLLEEKDVDVRLGNIVSALQKVYPPLPKLISEQSLVQMDKPLNCALLSILFTRYCQHQPMNDLTKEKALHDDILTSWKKLRSLLLDLRRREIKGDEKIATVLLKEARACEANVKTLAFRLRHKEQIVIASSHLLATKIQSATELVGKILEAEIMNEKPDIIDEKDRAIMKSYLAFNDNDIKDVVHVGLCSSPTTVQGKDEIKDRMRVIKDAFRRHAKELHSTFKYYCAGEVGNSSDAMSASEFTKFIQDTKLFSKDYPMTVLELMFLQATHAQREAKRELQNRDFCILLTRIAHCKFQGCKFEERVDKLLTEYILPNATRSTRDEFRQRMSTSEIQSVLRKHKQLLQRVFRYYACLLDDDHQNTMNITEFQALVRDCRLGSTFCTEQHIRHVFINIQREVVLSDRIYTGDNNDLVVDYIEFQEAIVVVAQFAVCTPYIPLFQRVDQFINNMIQPRAKQKKIIEPPK